MSSSHQVLNEQGNESKTHLTAIKGNKSVSGSCPISAMKVNEAGVRIIATITSLTILTSLFIFQPYKIVSVALMVFLALDFSARGFGYKRYSLLAHIASGIISLFKIKAKDVNAGPKIFAAKIGFICSLSTGVSFTLDWNIVAMGIAGLFLFCAALESIFNYCVGCTIYGFIYRAKVCPVNDVPANK